MIPGNGIETVASSTSSVANAADTAREAFQQGGKISTRKNHVSIKPDVHRDGASDVNASVDNDVSGSASSPLLSSLSHPLSAPSEEVISDTFDDLQSTRNEYSSPAIEIAGTGRNSPSEEKKRPSKSRTYHSIRTKEPEVDSIGEQARRIEFLEGGNFLFRSEEDCKEEVSHPQFLLRDLGVENQQILPEIENMSAEPEAPLSAAETQYILSSGLTSSQLSQSGGEVCGGGSAGSAHPLVGITEPGYMPVDVETPMDDVLGTLVTSQYRRRIRSRGMQSSSSASSMSTTPPSIVSTASSSTTNSSRTRPSNYPLSAGASASGNRPLEITHEETNDTNGNRMKASLDAGMAAVRRWIRSQSSFASTGRNNLPAIATSRHGRQSRSGASVDSIIVDAFSDIGSAGLREDGEFMFSTVSIRDLSGAEVHAPRAVLQQLPMLRMEILIEEERVRQRAQSEPDVNQLRDFYQREGQSAGPTALQQRISRNIMRRRRRGRAFTEDEETGRLSSSAAAALLMNTSVSSTTTGQQGDGTSLNLGRVSTNGVGNNVGSTTTGQTSRRDDDVENQASSTALDIAAESTEEVASSNTSSLDRERQARMRWVQINRRFQFVITVVALVFSLLLFGILISWVIMTSAYVVSFDKNCDVPLKAYFWLATFQLLLDVFRSDIMRFAFNWDSQSNQRIPCRIIGYNIAYLLYASLVLRMGIQSVFVFQGTCQSTAPELFNACIAFVSLSIAAWATIFLGYLLPFCVVAGMLTYNGYHPSSSSSTNVAQVGATQPVFPAAYSTTGAPRGTVDRLSVIDIDSAFPAEYPRECCICMEDFDSSDVVVVTPCNHVFHKQCFREWLRQARTCPVCRTDIPSSLSDDFVPPEQRSRHSAHNIPVGPTGRPVMGLFRILQAGQGNNIRSTGSGSINDNQSIHSASAVMEITATRSPLSNVLESN